MPQSHGGGLGWGWLRADRFGVLALTLEALVIRVAMLQSKRSGKRELPIGSAGTPHEILEAQIRSVQEEGLYQTHSFTSR